MLSRKTTFLLLVALSFASLPVTGFAKDKKSCTKSELSNPPRVVYKCKNGLVLEAEAAAKLNIENGPDGGRPLSATLSSNAILIEITPGSGPFQILTPQAIASVRGTIYAVDVTGKTTSVFVVRGEVAVARPNGSQSVKLVAGEGVEVNADPMVTKIWPKKKAAKLLARFGR